MELFELDFASLKKYFANCDYKINDDDTPFGGTLQNTNCVNEPIIPAFECETNLDKCYSGIDNYKTTKIPLRFYKKTRMNKQRFDTITEIVVPSGTDIYVNNEEHRARVSIGVVGKQYLLDGDYENKMYVRKTNSIYDRFFEYETDKVVKPDKFWNQTDDAEYRTKPNICNNGIHVFNSEDRAKEYYF